MERRPVSTRRRRLDHQRRVPDPAQCARARLQGAPEPGGVLGRPLDRGRRIPVRQAGRLRAGPARPGRLHGLRPGGDEGADEGRRRSATPSSASRTAASSASPSPASSPPSRPIRSSTSWSSCRTSRSGSRPSCAWRTASSCFPAGPAPPRRSSTCSACCSIRRTREQPLPVVLTGPARERRLLRADSRSSSRPRSAPTALTRLKVIVDDPAAVARHLVRGIEQVRDVPPRAQRLLQLQLAAARAARVAAAVRGHPCARCARCSCIATQPVHELAANLRRAFSGIVTGNVKEHGIAAIERDGPYELSGDPESCGCSTGCSPRSWRSDA